MQTTEPDASSATRQTVFCCHYFSRLTHRDRRKIMFVLRIFPMGTFLIFEKNGRKTPVLASTFSLRKMMLIKHPEKLGKLEFQTLTSTLSEAKRRT